MEPQKHEPAEEAVGMQKKSTTRYLAFNEVHSVTHRCLAESTYC